MDMINDPDTFQTSDIVEKSSKSGIFSNKRLLVIKSGFLYYFTNVPKKYKGHIPNVLNSLKQLPKSSIQIRAIQHINMQSSNSSNLTIKFEEKDMIDREQIRKSIANDNYQYTQKEKKALEQWKFTFPTVLKCRLWFTALLKLKNHFEKQQKKIAEFFNNFNPAKRNSHIPTEVKPAHRTTNSQISIIEEFKKNDQNKKQQPKQQQKHRPSIPVLPPSNPPPPPSKVETQKKDEQEFNGIVSQQSYPILETINEEQEHGTLKDDQSSKNLQLQSPIHKKIINTPNQTQSPTKLQLPLSTIQPSITKEEQQLLAEQIRKQEREKADRIIQKMQQDLQKKQREVSILAKALNSKQKQLEVLEKSKEEIKEADIVDQGYTLRTVQLNQFSVQTDSEDDFLPNNLTQSFQIVKKTKNYDSFLEDFNSTQRDTYNFYRNTDSLSLELEQSQKNYDHYDFYTEVGNLYLPLSHKKNGKGQNPHLKFEEQIKKEIKLINYIEKMRIVAEETIKEYIDETIANNANNFNQTNQSISFQSTLFYIKLACSSGKIVNINGKEKLVYSNIDHQNLKREFKAYNMLQNQILKIVKKRSNFPLRVPLSYLFEYRGFTALLKYLPYTKPIIDSSQQSMSKLYRLGQKICISNEEILNYQFSLIANRSSPLYLLNLKKVYKITKHSSEDDITNIQLQIKSQNIYSVYESIKGFRQNNHSTNNFELTIQLQLMEEQLKALGQKRQKRKLNYIQIERQRSLKQKMMSIQQFILCRNLKNLYRSTEPFTNNQDNIPYTKKQLKYSTFLQGFMSTPETIRDLVSVNDTQRPVYLNGIFLSYIEELFGLQIPNNLNLIDFFKEYLENVQNLQSQYDQSYIQEQKFEEDHEQIYEEQLKAIKISVKPVCRSFVLSEANAHKLLDSIDLYIETEKYNLVDSAIEVMHQIDHRKPENDWKLHLTIIKYKLKGISKGTTKKTSETRDNIEVVQRCRQQLEEMLKNIPNHSILKFQCQLLLIQTYIFLDLHPETIQLIFSTINHLHYMLGQDFSGGEMDDCLYLLAAQILAKMGKTEESLTIFKKLLVNEEKAIANEQVFLSLASSANYLMNIGPKQMIEMLLPLISESDPHSKENPQIASTNGGCYLSKHHSRIYNLIGHQYLLLRNIDQGTKYFEYSLAYYLSLMENNTADQKYRTISQINIITMRTQETNSQIEIDIATFTDNCLELFKIYSHSLNTDMMIELINMFNKFIEWSALTIYSVGGVCWRREKVFFLTKVSQLMIKNYLMGYPEEQQSRKENMIEILEKMRDPQIQQSDYDISEQVQYKDIESAIVKIAAKSEQLSQKQISAIKHINLIEVQTYLLAL